MGSKSGPHFSNKTHSEPPQTFTRTGLPSSARPFASSRQPDATKHTDNTNGPSMTNSHHNKQIANKDAENIRSFCVRAVAKTNLTKHSAPIEQGTQSDRKNTRQSQQLKHNTCEKDPHSLSTVTFCVLCLTQRSPKSANTNRNLLSLTQIK